MQYPLKVCDTGYVVLLVQQALEAQGFDVPTSGNFDPATDAAVRAYQQQFGLTVDGLGGPRDLDAPAARTRRARTTTATGWSTRSR